MADVPTIIFHPRSNIIHSTKMNYASPAAQLLELLTVSSFMVIIIVASLLFLRERTAGAWMMLIGSAFLLISKIPGVIYFTTSIIDAREINQAVVDIMYLPAWEWLMYSSCLLFALGLLLFAIQRRNLSKRIDELETILANLNENR